MGTQTGMGKVMRTGKIIVTGSVIKKYGNWNGNGTVWERNLNGMGTVWERTEQQRNGNGIEMV